jgi:hypothetical protein
MLEHIDFNDLEPEHYENEHDQISDIHFDEVVSHTLNVYANDTDLPSHSSDETLTTTILQWSFGFSTENIINVLRSIPSSLKHQLNAIGAVLETISHDAWLQNHNQFEKCTKQNINPNHGNILLWRNEQHRLIVDEESEQCAVLRISSEEVLSFNSRLMDIWGLIWAAVHTKTFGCGVAFPFHVIDYLCIIVHDIENSFKEETIRYCRVMSPNASPQAAHLVCMLTRKKFKSSGALEQVRHSHPSHSTLLALLDWVFAISRSAARYAGHSPYPVHWRMPSHCPPGSLCHHPPLLTARPTPDLHPHPPPTR